MHPQGLPDLQGKDKERDLHKLRKEIIELKHKNAGLGTQLQEEKTKLS